MKIHHGMVWGIVDSGEDLEIIEKESDKLEDWSHRNGIKSVITKGNIMNRGRIISSVRQQLISSKLQKKDCGVLTDHRMLI